MVPHKIQASASSHKGFTLVELIVVITILAILGTIGFLSLQGYSGQSRDSKRTADLRSLSTAITTKSTEGLGYLSFVTAVTASALTNASIAGATPTGTQYAAGTPNPTVLGINQANFNDPVTGAPYRIGSTTQAGGSFQLGARLEAGGTPTASITGNYANRAATVFTLAAAAASTATQVTLPSSAVGLFKKGDAVTFATPSITGTVAAISSDWLTMTLAAALGTAVTTSTTVALTAAESTGLLATVAPTASTTTPVTNGSTANLPY